MNSRTWLTTAVALITFGISSMGSIARSEEGDKLAALGGEWLYVQDLTKGRALEDQGPRMSPKFVLRVEKDAVVYPRPRGDERITLDGSAIEKKKEYGSVSRYSGVWKDGSLVYTMETVRLSDNKRVLQIRREFRVTDDGLKVSVSLNGGASSVSLYQHPKDIELPTPAKAKVADVAWIHAAWVGSRGKASTEERWGPPLGGAMLGVSRTVAGGKMVAFEYLRIVERDGGLVYIAQPSGNPPTEFVLTKLEKGRAVFVNPRHNYPQRIEYALSKDGALTASIGFAKGGRPQKFEFKREGK